VSFLLVVIQTGLGKAKVVYVIQKSQHQMSHGLKSIRSLTGLTFLEALEKGKRTVWG
jgi:hypothetical protein